MDIAREVFSDPFPEFEFGEVWRSNPHGFQSKISLPLPLGKSQKFSIAFDDCLILLGDFLHFSST